MNSKKNNAKPSAKKTTHANPKKPTAKKTSAGKTTPKKTAAPKNPSTAKVAEAIFTLPVLHEILKDDGSAMVSNLLGEAQPTNFIIPLALNFNRNIFETILNLTGTEGIRTYFALDSNAHLKLVITGIDKDGNDIYITSAKDGKIYVGDMGQACPLYDASKITLP